MKLKPFLLFLFMFGNSIVNSAPQEQLVKGSVTDAITGEPLYGVNVIIEGTQIGISTDSDGKFSLPMPANGSILIFSFVGYATEKVTFTGQAEIDIKLSQVATRLDDIVVVGYGSQSKRNISGSVANVTEKNFNKGVSQDAIDLIQGKVAGLVVTKAGGDVTDNKTIRLRGISSLTGSSEPFVVIDGIPGLSINSVTPQNIESISILKDASAAAIYGSRSASGVILITTKKGMPGKTNVEYDGYIAFDKVANKPRMLTSAEWIKWCYKNNIKVKGYDKGGNTDWFDAIMRTGITSSHNLAFSGGTDKSSYRVSVGYLNQQGVAIKNDTKRINGRLSFNQKALNDHLELKFAINALQSDNRPMDKSNFGWAYALLPVYPIKNSDGSWYNLIGLGGCNPVQNIALNSSLHKNSLLSTNMRAVITFLKGLTADINLFKQREMDDYGLYFDSRTGYGYADQGFAQRSNWTNDRNLLELTLNYLKKIGDHNLTIMGGYSYEDNYSQNSGAQNRQFVTDQFNYNNLGSGADLKDGDVWSGRSMSRLISFFGRLNYNFKEKYLLTATLRRDGSSKFGKNNKWGIFPSVSAAWHLSSEPFMRGIKVISDLKLRGGYGVNGNQDAIPPYTSLALYGPSAVKYYDNGKYYTAYEYAQNPNPDLKWEQTAMTNLGSDFSIFSGRIRGTIDFYYKKTSNLLYNYSVPMPPYLYPTILANVGTISNKGFEFMLDVDPVQTSDLKWTVSASFAMNRNKILNLSNEEFSTSSVYTGNALVPGVGFTNTQILEEGNAVGTFFGWKCLGLDNNGKFRLQVKDSLAGPTDEDKTYIGSAQPKFTFGIQNSITYKRFELNFFLRGVYGNDVLNLTRMTYANTLRMPGENVLKEALTSGINDAPTYCSYYIVKGSFLRLDNASLSYDFNADNFWGIEKIRINCTVQNLFVITRYKGVDPEVDMSGLAPGVQDAGYYPKSRTFLFGIDLKF